MAVTGTGMFGKPLELLRTLLSSLAAVQEWMGVDEMPDAVGQAERRIYVNQYDEALEEAGTPAQAQAARDARPLIVIGSDQFTSNEETTGAPWSRTGSMWCDFEEVARNGDGPETSSNPVTSADALMSLMNSVGAIMAAAEAAVSSVAASAQVDGVVLDMIGYDVTEQAARTAEEARGPANGIDLCGMKLTIRRRDP